MIKRKEILNRLNQLTLRYNLTWEDIVIDADRAIDEINNLLGADYPPLSSKLLNDNSTYSENGLDMPIIKDEYFHSIIIPFIAMEVLARDEEFTTIFSKYQSDFVLGKANMFKKEFNYVPDLYKRTRPEGVFFPANTKVHKHKKHVHPTEPNPYGNEDN